MHLGLCQSKLVLRKNICAGMQDQRSHNTQGFASTRSGPSCRMSAMQAYSHSQATAFTDPPFPHATSEGSQAITPLDQPNDMAASGTPLP